MNSFIIKSKVGSVTGLRKLGEINRATVLVALIIELLAIIKFKTFASSALARICTLLKDFPKIRSAVSSAKNLGTVSKKDRRSLI